MFSISLLFVLIGSVLSSEYPSADGTTLLGMIRRDPNALVSIFDTADKTKVDKIIELLNNLIGEGTAEIAEINKEIVGCRKKVSDAKERHNQAVAKLASLASALATANGVVSTTEGAWTESKEIYGRESPAIKKEIEVFNKVLRILNNLLNGGKSLAEEDTAEVRAFISLEDQADPVKVKKIIGLVQGLLKISQTELAALEKAVNDAKAAFDAATVARNKAFGAWTAQKAVVEKAKLDLDNVVGACARHLKISNERIAVVNEEIKTLGSVITLLKQVQ